MRERVRQPAVQGRRDLALDDCFEPVRVVLPAVVEVDVLVRAVGVHRRAAVELDDVDAVDVVDLAVDRPQSVGVPLVAEAVVVGLLELDVGIAEPAIERLRRRRLGELADVRLQRPEVVELELREQPRVDVAAVLAVEQVAVDAQRRDQPQPRRDLDAEVDVRAEPDGLRARSSWLGAMLMPLPFSRLSFCDASAL